jgi:hypothetical protein
MKATDEEFPDYTTPVDELVERFRIQGMKIAFGEHPESGNVFVIPADSHDVGSDGIFPRQLRITPAMDERIRRLIAMNREGV